MLQKTVSEDEGGRCLVHKFMVEVHRKEGFFSFYEEKSKKGKPFDMNQKEKKRNWGKYREK